MGIVNFVKRNYYRYSVFTGVYALTNLEWFGLHSVFAVVLFFWIKYAIGIIGYLLTTVGITLN